MPYDGSGNFTRVYNWTADRNADIRIQAARMDGECNDYASAFNQVMLRSGVAAMTGNLNMGQQRVVGIAPGSEGAPGLTFFGDNVSGLFLNGVNNIAVATNGLRRLQVSNASTQVFNRLVLADSGFVFASDGSQNTGMSWASDGVVNFISNGNVVGGFNSAGFLGTLNGNVIGNVFGNVSGTASNVTGVVAVANGGTGVTTATGSGSVVRADNPSFSTAITVAGPVNAGTSNGVSLGMANNSAIRNASSIGNTMFFDSGVGGGSTSGDFNFRATAAFTSCVYIRGSDGNVGIGTTSPGARLEIVGPALNPATASTYGLWVANSGGANGDLALGSNASASFIQSFGAKPLRINSVGNAVVVGGNPATVWSNFTVSSDIAIQQAQPSLNFVNAAGSVRFGYIYHTGVGGTMEILNQQNGPIAFATNSTERARISAEGNMAIGNTTPGANTRLNVSGRGLFTGGSFDSFDGTASGVSISYDTVNNVGIIGAVQTGVTERTLRLHGQQIQFFVSAAERATLNSSGNFAVTGTLSDSLGNARRMVKAAATSGVLTSASANQWIRATGGITLNNSVFAANDWLTIVNKSGGAITITQGAGLTLTDAFGATGNRTLANHGICTVIFNAANDAIISGTGLT